MITSTFLSTSVLFFAQAAETAEKVSAKGAPMLPRSFWLALLVLAALFIMRFVSKRLRRHQELMRDSMVLSLIPVNVIVFDEKRECLYRKLNREFPVSQPPLLELGQMCDSEDFPKLETAFQQVIATGKIETIRLKHNGICWQFRLERFPGDKKDSYVVMICFQMLTDVVTNDEEQHLQELTKEYRVQCEAETQKDFVLYQREANRDALFARGYAQLLAVGGGTESVRRASQQWVERNLGVLPVSQSKYPVNILLLEEDKDLITLICAQAKALGWEIKYAMRLQEAFQNMSQQHFDVILTSTQLQKDDLGRSFLTLLRSDSKFDMMPVVGYSPIKLSDEEGKKEGFAGILQMPWSLIDFQEKILKLLPRDKE